MKTKYLLIDDEPSAESYGVTLERADRFLKVDLVEEREPRAIERLIRKTKPNGLLLDLQLTKSRGKSEKFFQLDGPGLAQEFRTRSNAERSLKIPIVSLSFDERRDALIGEDSTSKDLFDDDISKKEVSENAKLFAKRLIDLSNGYEELRKSWRYAPSGNTLAKILGINEQDLERVDGRLLRDLEALARRPIHNVAGFFLHGFLQFSGPLISEQTLAVRLGVDPAKRGKAWETLKAKLPKKTRYAGIFSTTHERWWMWQIMDWWQALDGAPGSLSMITAGDRVSYLKRKFKIDRLPTIEETTQSPGSRFWHVCVKSGLPVDPPEGYIIADHERMQPWHDKRYLCRNAALRSVRDFVFEPGEKERLKIFGKRR